MKHKHAEFIKAWADGAEIEWRMPQQTTWYDVHCPLWYEVYEYRIKPEIKQPVVRWKWTYPLGDIWRELEYFYSEDEVNREGKGKLIKLEYTRTEFPE